MVQRLRLLAVLVGGLAGCGGEAVAPPEPAQDPVPLYWRLTLNQHAITLDTAAPYDTFRLVATPRGLGGTLLNGLPAVQFTSLEDPVLVSPDGLVRGLQPTTAPVPILATLTDTLRNLTHTDIAYVRVTTTANPPMLAQLVIEPTPPDSAKAAWEIRALSQFSRFYYPQPRLTVHTLDAQGAAIPNLGVWVKSSDPATGHYDNLVSNPARRLRLGRPGVVAFYASTSAYGVERADTLVYRVGLPLFAVFQVITDPPPLGGTTPTYRFSSSVVTVATGAYVWWFRPSGVPVYSATFGDPTNVAADAVIGDFTGCGPSAGHIGVFGDPTDDNTEDDNFFADLCSRFFPVAGTYSFHSAVLNDSATVVVVDERQAAALLPATRSLSVPSSLRRLRGSRGGEASELPLEWRHH